MNFEQPDSNEMPLDKKISKRDFIKTTLGALSSVALTKGIIDVLPDNENKSKEPMLSDDDFLNEEGNQESESLSEDIPDQHNFENENREEIDWREFKKLKPNLQYKEVVPRLNIENLRMPDDVGRYGASTHDGKILRTLRYKNICNAVEDRYNLPQGILLAMIMEESTGVDLLPNARGDGGFGLCHMQGSTATEYGLNTFHKCNSLVCDGKDSRSCKNPEGKLVDHAGGLSSFMENNTLNRKVLTEADDRLNILLNIDAAGRMLATGIAGPKLKGKLSELGPLRRAIARYAGSYNYENYWKDISRNIKDLTSPDVIKKIEESFNSKNPHLKINGEGADFDTYMKKFQEQHINYGLHEYEKLPKYLPKNSVAVMETYKEYI